MKLFQIFVLLILIFKSPYAFGESIVVFDLDRVPFPNRSIKEASDTTRYDTLADFLADVAVTKNPEDCGKLLAAARRISPFNEKAFYTEFELVNGMQPSQTIPLEPGSFESEFQSKLRVLSGSDWYGYRQFLNKVLIGKQVESKTVATFEMSEVSGRTSCMIPLLEGGVTKVQLKRNPISTDSFQLLPGNIDSRYFRLAFREVIKYFAQTESKALTGIRLSFESDRKVDSEDGPVAGLASAMMINSLLSEEALDPEVCYSGDVNADGSVQPMNDQYERIVSALKSPPKIMVIPKGDHYSTDDSLLISGAGFFVNCQVFEVEHVNEAIAISKAERDENLTRAIGLYSKIQEVLKRPDGKKYFKNSHVRERLEAIVKLAPNHVSANHLLRASTGQMPRYLSLYHSFDLVYSPLEGVFKSGEIKKDAKLDLEAFGRMEKYKSRIDPKLNGLVNAIVGFQSIERSTGNKIEESRSIMVKKLKEELSLVSRDVRIRERIMR